MGIRTSLDLNYYKFEVAFLYKGKTGERTVSATFWM